MKPRLPTSFTIPKGRLMVVVIIPRVGTGIEWVDVIQVKVSHITHDNIPKEKAPPIY